MTILNRARVVTPTTGQGTLTLGAAAAANALTFAGAGATDGMTVTYCIEEGVDFEIGRGVIGDSATTLTRATVLKSLISGAPSTARMELSGSAEVFCVISAEDHNDVAGLAGRFARLPETIKTASWTAAVGDEGRVLAYNSPSAGVVTLPAVADARGPYFFRTVGSGALTIDPAGAEQIEGAASLVLSRGRAAIIWPNEGKMDWRAMVMLPPALAAVAEFLRVDASSPLTAAQKAAGQDNLGLTVAPRSGLVAGPTRVLTVQHATNKVMNSRIKHRAYEKITSLKLVYANWYVGSASGNHPYAETNGGSRTIAASIEYPRGVITRCKFGGSFSTVQAAGDTTVTDDLPILIPEGAEFWVRSWQDAGSDTLIYSASVPASDADQNATEYGTAGAYPDKTASGTITSLSLAVSYGPVAIVGQTARSGALIVGDSRAWGTGDAMDVTLDAGTVGRSVGREFAYINACRSGERAGEMLASGAKRAALAQYCTHVIAEYGTNDIHSEGVSAATLKTRLEGIIAMFPALPVYIATLEPNTTSSDSWATIANQTVHANNAVRVAHNAAVRAGTIVGAKGYFEIADALESGRDSGKWKVTGVANGYTADGNHPTPAGARLVRDLGVVDPKLFRALLQQVPRFASIEETVAGQANNLIVSPATLVKAWETPNGIVRQYADGMMECELIATFGGAIDTAMGSAFRTPAFTWTFPEPFVRSPPSICVSNVDTDYATYAWGIFGRCTLSEVQIAIMRMTTTSQNPRAKLFARGYYR